jgi:hypothetical protein
MVDISGNARCEAIRQLAELRTRLEAAENELAAAEASHKEAQSGSADIPPLDELSSAMVAAAHPMPR